MNAESISVWLVDGHFDTSGTSTLGVAPRVVDERDATRLVLMTRQAVDWRKVRLGSSADLSSPSALGDPSFSTVLRERLGFPD